MFLLLLTSEDVIQVLTQDYFPRDFIENVIKMPERVSF